MATQVGYVTNDVEGSFWRPYDYMAKVSDKHVIAEDVHSAAKAKAEAAVAATVSFSAKGRELLMKRSQDAVQFASEDGVVRRYSFNIASNDLQMIDIAL